MADAQLLSSLTKLKSLRKLTKQAGLSKSDKQLIIENLLTLISEDEAIEELERQRQANTDKLVGEYKRMLEEAGLTVEQFGNYMGYSAK